MPIDARVGLSPAQRFAGDLAAIAPAGRLGLAVSGGPDSLALLWLAQASAGLTFEVATVDHQLRPEAEAEVAGVARLCGRLAVSCAVLRVDVQTSGNLQANARTARYRALGQWARERGLAGVATGHHADDQAETLLLRLMRGSGLRGLAGMRARSPLPGWENIPLLRPLLGWRRAELTALVAAAGWVAADDPSNRDPRFDRVALRQEMAKASWLDPVMIAASAAHLAQAESAIGWAAEQEWQAAVVDLSDDSMFYAPRAPAAVRLRVIERIVGTLATEGSPRGAEVARLLARLESGQASTLAGVRSVPAAEGWYFSPAPPRRG